MGGSDGSNAENTASIRSGKSLHEANTGARDNASCCTAEHANARFPGLPPHARLSEESAGGIERTCDRVVGLRQRQTRFLGRSAASVDDLLFKDEAELPPRIEGSAAFQAAFCREAPRADNGSSLKDLQLAGYLFKNRCSYLIYSECFRTLPTELKRRIYSRLVRALDPESPDSRYDYIPAEERSRISKNPETDAPGFSACPRLGRY
jgi:hypothetical protein